MKTLLHLLIKSSFIVTLFFIVSSNVKAQWQQDIRLTNALSNSNTSSNNAKCIGVNYTGIHVVWYDNRNGGNPEIYYKRSTDNGSNWESDFRLTNNSAISMHPSISVSDSLINVVWTDNRDGNLEIYYKRSTNSGINWSSDIRITNNSAESWHPSVSVSGQIISVVWSDYRDAGDQEIYNKLSSNSGLNWGPENKID